VSAFATPDRAAQTDLTQHALGFVVRTEGRWTERDLAAFRHFLKLRRLSPSDEELAAIITAASEVYTQGEHRLYVCGASPCCTREDPAPNDNQSCDVPITRTGCQGLCKHAPVAALRVGSRTQVFAEFSRAKDWLSILDFAGKAARDGSLAISAGRAGQFFHDEEHDRDAPQLEPLRFLVGHFRGEGVHVHDGYRFQKEVIGSYEAGGRFISLRMDARYPTTDGRHDVHRALVIVGARQPSGQIKGQAFTDGGTTHEYVVQEQEGGLQFLDVSPDHGQRWKLARKVLQPTANGYQETLEVDAQDGAGFAPYSTLPMRRIAP